MNLHTEVQLLADELARTQTRIVLAESCTAGLVAATLASVPGISQWLCGSAVVYREATKSEWLEVDARMIAKHSAVSAVVTMELTKQVLAKTPEAHLALAVTGHLGPDAPAELDGVIYIGVQWRGQSNADASVRAVRAVRLTAAERVPRQQEATRMVISDATRALRTRR